MAGFTGTWPEPRAVGRSPAQAFRGCRGEGVGGAGTLGDPAEAVPPPPAPAARDPGQCLPGTHALTLTRTLARSHSAGAELRETCRRPGVSSRLLFFCPCYTGPTRRPRGVSGWPSGAPLPPRLRGPGRPRGRETGVARAPGVPPPPGKGHLGGARGRPERGPGLRGPGAPRDAAGGSQAPGRALTCGGGGGAGPGAPGTRGWARGVGRGGRRRAGAWPSPCPPPPAPSAARAGAGPGPDALPQSCGPRAGGRAAGRAARRAGKARVGRCCSGPRRARGGGSLWWPATVSRRCPDAPLLPWRRWGPRAVVARGLLQVWVPCSLLAGQAQRQDWSVLSSAQLSLSLGSARGQNPTINR